MTQRLLSVLSLLTLLVVFLVSPNAKAACAANHLIVTSNATLPGSGTFFGSVTIGANNVTLDCKGREIHHSCRSVNNCPSGHCGIAIQNHSNVKIVNCKVIGSYSVGIWANNADVLRITDTFVAGVTENLLPNSGTGYFIQESEAPYLLRANASVNEWDGIALRHNDHAVLQDLTVANSIFRGGIDENRGDYTQYLTVTASDNPDNGFECDDCIGTQYSGCTADAPTGNSGEDADGLSLDRSFETEIVNNTFLNQGAYGLRVGCDNGYTNVSGTTGIGSGIFDVGWALSSEPYLYLLSGNDFRNPQPYPAPAAWYVQHCP